MRAIKNLAILEVGRGGNVTFATPGAIVLLNHFFHPIYWEHLPEPVREWVELQLLSPRQCTHPIGRLCSGELVVRIIGREEGHVQLLLDRQCLELSAERLVALGLTRREAEVLLWISQGKTSGEIATILYCTAATVSKHTEHIFYKLKVETRTAAAALALELLKV